MTIMFRKNRGLTLLGSSSESVNLSTLVSHWVCQGKRKHLTNGKPLNNGWLVASQDEQPNRFELGHTVFLAGQIIQLNC